MSYGISPDFLALEFDAHLLSRLLRKEAIDRAVLISKIAALACGTLLLSWALWNSLSGWHDSQKKIAAVQDQIKARLERVSAPGLTRPEGGDYQVIVKQNVFGPLTQRRSRAEKPKQPAVSTVPLSLIGLYVIVRVLL